MRAIFFPSLRAIETAAAMKTENVLTAGTFDSFWPAHEKSFSVAHAVAAAKDCARKRENIGAPLRAYRDLKVA